MMGNMNISKAMTGDREMKVIKTTPRTRLVIVAGEEVKIKLNKRTYRQSGYFGKMESSRTKRTTYWTVDKLPHWSTCERRQMEAVLLAVDSGMSWEEAKNVLQKDWIDLNSPPLI
jgi:hypothetical protein